MGGYGVYVWGSYAVTFVLLAVEVVMVIKRKRAARARTSVSERELDAGSSKLETGLSH
jgi:heme exporter protein D